MGFFPVQELKKSTHDINCFHRYTINKNFRNNCCGMLLIATLTASTAYLVKSEHSLLYSWQADMISNSGIPGGIFWTAIKKILIYDAVIILMEADSVLLRMYLISYLVMFALISTWLGKATPKLFCKAVVISIIGEHLVSSMPLEKWIVVSLWYIFVLLLITSGP